MDRAAGVAAVLGLAMALSLASCGEEREVVETPPVEVAGPTDLTGVQVELHQAPG